jgi:hypothetical protein
MIKIIYINLDGRTDRNEKFIKNFDKCKDKLILKRFSAVNTNFDNAINCGYSHLTIFRHFTEVLNEDFVIVAEDDTIPTENFNLFFEVVDWCKNNLNKWDFINLSTSTVSCFGWCPINLKKATNFSKKYSGLYETASTSASNFVIYNRTMKPFFDEYEKILSLNGQNKFNIEDVKHVDHIFGNEKYFPELRRFISFPLLGIQNDNYSNISSCEINYELIYNKCNDEIKMYLEKNYINKNFLTTELRGGLGNQLFQIFSTLAYSFRLNRDFILEKKLNITNTNETKRNTYYDSLFTNINYYELNDSNSFHWKEINSIEIFCIENKENESFNNIKIKNSYFQNFNLFDFYFEKINNILKFSLFLEKIKLKYFLEKIQNKNINIGIHFRYGDYKYKQNDHPILKLSYYINCMKQINDEKKNVLIFCEKEDKELIMSFFQENGVLKTHVNSFYFIDDDLLDYEQMFILSLIENIVISNSTFSWWSAYLRSKLIKDEQIKVFFPKIWFHEETSYDLIYYKNWYGIDDKE